MFEPGREKTGGRQAGTPNKKTLLRASAVLAEKGISPTEELIKIAQDPETKPGVRVELWKYLHSFVEAPQTVAQAVSHASPEGSVDGARKIAEHLAELSRPLEPANPSSPQP